MIDATVCTYSNGESGIVVWKDRDHPTEEELNPANSQIHSHVVLPHDWLAFLRKDQKIRFKKFSQDSFLEQTHNRFHKKTSLIGDWFFCENRIIQLLEQLLLPFFLLGFVLVSSIRLR